MNKMYMLRMIERLRIYEELVLYGNVLRVDKEEEKAIAIFLAKEYEREIVEYPYETPDFDEESAVWAAKVLYLAGQLYLDRQIDETEWQALFPPKMKPKTAGEMLSADLCLRFLAELIEALDDADPDDLLIPFLEDYLWEWPYTSLTYEKQPNRDVDMTVILPHPCLKALYCERVIDEGLFARNHHEAIVTSISESMGDYTAALWPAWKNRNEK